MNDIISNAAELAQCDMQTLETATAIVHLNAPATLTTTEALPVAVATPSKAAACDVCGKIFSRYNLDRHKRTHRGEKLFSCVRCSRSFSQKSHLTVHERIHTGERPFKCNICGCAFSRKDYLVRHTRTQHSGKVYTINNQTVTTPVIPPPKQQRAKKVQNTVNVTVNHTMPQQEQQQPATGNASYHAQQSIPIATTVSPQSQAQPPASNIPLESPSATFDCEECWKEYTQQQQQQQQQQQLNRNAGKLNNKETQVKYKCDFCNKVFPEYNKMNTHRKTHMKPKIFVCDVCQKAFSRRDHLNVHKRVHSGERPFKCDICGYAFTRIDHLMRHRRPNKGMRKLSCVPQMVIEAQTVDGSPQTATVVTAEEDNNATTQTVVSVAVADGSTPTTIVVPPHQINNLTTNGQGTTIATLTNVPHHVTVQPLYHTNIPQQITMPFHPQQLDVATMQIYTTTK